MVKKYIAKNRQTRRNPATQSYRAYKIAASCEWESGLSTVVGAEFFYYKTRMNTIQIDMSIYIYPTNYNQEDFGNEENRFVFYDKLCFDD